MKNIQIKQIQQKDNHTFFIEWTDAITHIYHLSDLQKKCPCASCKDEVSGLRRSNAPFVDDHVRAKKIFSVGRYAIQIEFTSGCSHGIYSFDFLREYHAIS